MPAALEIVGDALDGLVQLALDLAGFGRKLRWSGRRRGKPRLYRALGYKY